MTLTASIQITSSMNERQVHGAVQKLTTINPPKFNSSS